MYIKYGEAVLGMKLRILIRIIKRKSVCLLDSKETALLEIAAFFPEFDAMKWLQSQECKLFEEGKVKYNKERFCHEPVM